MRRTASLAAIRLILVALIAQPAGAALIHDTAIRYPVIGAILATIEACVIAYGAKAVPAPEATLGDYLAGVRRITHEVASTNADDPPASPPR
jgi:hypothetical protein